MEELVEKEKTERGHLAAEWSGEGTTLVSCGRVQCDLTPLGSSGVALAPGALRVADLNYS